MRPLKLRVHYYETDKMGIVHHSNYIRWMEDARVDLMEQIGYGYERFEHDGLQSPVLGYSCKIKESTKFSEVITVDARIVRYNGVRIIFEYTITKENGHIAATGQTEHCFIDADGKVVMMRKANPKLHELILKYREN